MAGDEGEEARRAHYEELYAAYRYAVRVLEEARANGASLPTLRRMRERVNLLRALLAAWRGAA